MARYALIGPSEIFIREEDESKIDFSAALRTGYRRVVVVPEVDDQSTGAHTKRSTADIIEPTQLRRVTTIVDMTAQEISAAQDAATSRLDTTDRDLTIALGLVTRGLFGYVFELTNTVRANNGQGPITLAQFNAAFEANKDNVPLSAFKNKVKDQLN